MGDVLVSIGSNLDNREENIRHALDRMTAFFRIDNLSPLYESEPQDFDWQGWFINVVVSGFFNNDPLELLILLKDLERSMGRTKRIEKGPRIIDLDIIAFGSMIFQTPELTLPHPRMTERLFVLLPVKDIKPDFVHPVLGKSIDALISECSDKSVISTKSHPWRKSEEENPHEL